MSAFQSEEARASMVAQQLRARGIHDPAVLDAMGQLPREYFVPGHLAAEAYRDGPLPIGNGQTISQPFIVALMLQEAELRQGDRVLDVGTGSGYMAALIALITGSVWTVERHAPLLEHAKAAMERADVPGVRAAWRDGSTGWAEEAPFDAIVMSAATARVPERLIAQLSPGGRLVAPVGPESGPQRLLRWRRGTDGTLPEAADWLGDVAFVPLVDSLADGKGDQSGRQSGP